MFARLVATRPTVSLATTSTSTTTHATKRHARAFSFFSSKSGGSGDGNGNKYKYFTANSSSSQKSSPPNGANGNGGNGGAASSKPKMDGVANTATATATTVGPASATETTNTTPTTAKSQLSEDPKKKGDPSTIANVSPPPTSNSSTSGPLCTTNWQPQPVHTPLTAKDLSLHSFFSGHKPLLLLSQPSSSIFGSWPELQLSNNSDLGASRHQSLLNHLGGVNLEDPPEATPDEDADTARLLNRALVVNRLGGTVSWEETLAKLGLVEERMGLAEMRMGAHGVTHMSMRTDGFSVYMDSTKRKRRKKMKKHKLKKRRRVRLLVLFPLHPEFILVDISSILLVTTSAPDQDWQIGPDPHIRFSRYYPLNFNPRSHTASSSPSA